MGAFIFLCDTGTEQECLDRLLFGTNSGSVYQRSLVRIQIADYLFLWNFQTGILRGPFIALTKCVPNLEPNAWRDAPGHARGFPFQVRVGANVQYSQHLNADDLNRCGLLHPTPKGLMPLPELNDTQLRQVLDLFRQRNGDDRPPVSVGGAPVIPGNDKALATAFIFKCDRTTGGRCFAENIMGAPVQVFLSVVSTVQPGASMFLWQIEERKLFGLWKAKTRGQYDPTAFPEAAGRSFHAVVHCNREMNLTGGIDEPTLRGVVVYDGAIPPYVIDQSQANRLVDALLMANNAPDAATPHHQLQQGFLTEDGHWVKSQAELIIDNMLFSQRCVHAYEKRVQVGTRYLRCDFYLPPTDHHREIYVEYWGMLQQSEYAARRQEKLTIYRSANITPLELFPSDVAVLSEVWPAKLARYSR